MKLRRTHKQEFKVRSTCTYKKKSISPSQSQNGAWGKSMVRWFTFDILKNPHLTLAVIHAFKIISKL
jgi:hypothetical protein